MTSYEKLIESEKYSSRYIVTNFTYLDDAQS